MSTNHKDEGKEGHMTLQSPQYLPYAFQYKVGQNNRTTLASEELFN